MQQQGNHGHPETVFWLENAPLAPGHPHRESVSRHTRERASHRATNELSQLGQRNIPSGRRLGDVRKLTGAMNMTPIISVEKL